MVSVTSASRYIMSASHYHPRYQSRSSMYIHGLIPRNFAELAEVGPIDINKQTLTPSSLVETFILIIQILNGQLYI